MEVKEAIWRLKDHFRVHDDGRPTPKLDEACKIAYECMEKQLPKKVVIWGNRTEHCPVCDKDVTCTGFCVCLECYQLLDWSEAH